MHSASDWKKRSVGDAAGGAVSPLVSSVVDKATSELLQSPAWGVNMDICDSLNSTAWQAKDVVKAVTKRLQTKSTNVQLLSLTLLEAIVKNCGEHVHLQIAESDVLQELVKIVKKKTDVNVRDNILVLLESWQEAFGGHRGKYPHFYLAYADLKKSGFKFPPRSGGAAPIFTPPIARPIQHKHHASNARTAMRRKPSMRLDDAMATEMGTLSPADLVSIRRAMEPLGDMFQAVGPNDTEPAGYRGGKRKSVSLRAVRPYEEDSDPRYPRTRGISDDENVFDDEEGDDEESDDDGRYGLELEQKEYGRRRGSYSATEYIVRKGCGSRLVSGDTSSCTVKTRTHKKKMVDDDSWIVTDMMPGGPIDGSVILSFGGHIARRIWAGEDRKVLKYHDRNRACTTLQSWRSVLSADITKTIIASGLCHLPYSMFTYIDMPLISAFVERWQPDTNSFHLPFGEMTIMLHDVVQILRIPVEGRMVGAQASTAELKAYVAMLLGQTFTDLGKHNRHWSGSGVTIDSVDEFCRRCTRPDETQLTGYLFLLLGCILFVDKSDCRVRPHDILEARDPDTISEYSWGSATLTYLYRQLGIASRTDCGCIAGCLTLLQTWIYEYFPSFRPHRKRKIIESGYPRSRMWTVRNEDKSEGRLRSIRRQLDQMIASEVEWLPYGPDPAVEVPRTLLMGLIRYRDIIEPYLPDRVLRQLGYVQAIPVDIPTPEHAVRSESSTTYDLRYPVSTAEWIWQIFPRGGRLYLDDLTRSRDPSTSDAPYLSWFCKYSHPFLVRGTAQRPKRLPDRTCVDVWMSKAIRLVQPFLDKRDLMPTDDTRAACVKWDEFIHAWNSQLGISDPASEDET